MLLIKYIAPLFNRSILAMALMSFCHLAVAQDARPPQLLFAADVAGQNLSVDVLGDYYIIEGNSLTRYDSSGSPLFTYSNTADGQFTEADVSDPLKILLFNREFGRMRYLDNQLTTRGDVISLSELGFVNTTLVCSSYESGLWIYDPVSIQLIRFSNDLQATQFSGNIAQLAGVEINPNFLHEFNNVVYLCDSAQGVLVFDRYGAFLKTWPFKGVRSLRVSGETLFLFTGKSIVAYNTKTLRENTLALPVENAIAASIVQGRLYVMTPLKLFVYRVY